MRCSRLIGLLAVALAGWTTPAVARDRGDPCAITARVVSVLWTARSLADAVAPSWPGWRPALVEVRYLSREGLKIDVGREQKASCAGLAVPARIRGHARPPRRSAITLEKHGRRFAIEVVEGNDDLPLEDLLATLVHLHFHVHQYRHELDYHDVNPRGSAPDAAWAWRNLPAVPDRARRMGVLAEAIHDDGFSPEGAMALLTVRRQQAAGLKDGHPKLPGAVSVQERFEGLATYIEHQLVVVPAARKLLLAAGVPEARLDEDAWRKDALRVDSGFPAATGFATAIALDASGEAWKPQLGEETFDVLLELAAIHAVQ
ncbi:MAG: hypothetical protein R3F59_38970 [Myxococcota bacterium]